jgi:hypothetical protein
MALLLQSPNATSGNATDGNGTTTALGPVAIIAGELKDILQEGTAIGAIIIVGLTVVLFAYRKVRGKGRRGGAATGAG